MAISITLRDDKWRLRIESEEWEFFDKEGLRKVLEELLAYKDQYGQLHKKEE